MEKDIATLVDDIPFPFELARPPFAKTTKNSYEESI